MPCHTHIAIDYARGATHVSSSADRQCGSENLSVDVNPCSLRLPLSPKILSGRRWKTGNCQDDSTSSPSERLCRIVCSRNILWQLPRQVPDWSPRHLQLLLDLTLAGVGLILSCNSRKTARTSGRVFRRYRQWKPTSLALGCANGGVPYLDIVGYYRPPSESSLPSRTRRCWFTVCVLKPLSSTQFGADAATSMHHTNLEHAPRHVFKRTCTAHLRADIGGTFLRGFPILLL